MINQPSPPDGIDTNPQNSLEGLLPLLQNPKFLTKKYATVCHPNSLFRERLSHGSQQTYPSFTEDRALKTIGLNFFSAFLEGTETESETFSDEDNAEVVRQQLEDDQMMMATTDAGSSECHGPTNPVIIPSQQLERQNEALNKEAGTSISGELQVNSSNSASPFANGEIYAGSLLSRPMLQQSEKKTTQFVFQMDSEMAEPPISHGIQNDPTQFVAQEDDLIEDDELMVDVSGVNGNQAVNEEAKDEQFSVHSLVEAERVEEVKEKTKEVDPSYLKQKLNDKHQLFKKYFDKCLKGPKQRINGAKRPQLTDQQVKFIHNLKKDFSKLVFNQTITSINLFLKILDSAQIIISTLRETAFKDLNYPQTKIFTLVDITLSYVSIVIKGALKEDQFTRLKTVIADKQQPGADRIVDADKQNEEKNKNKVLRRKMFLLHCQAWCTQYRHICMSVLNLKRPTMPDQQTTSKQFEIETIKALQVSKKISKSDAQQKYNIVIGIIKSYFQDPSPINLIKLHDESGRLIEALKFDHGPSK
ncbi:hypothetical protein FGO68_gene11574 [Halteria grandinella]|uniref:Uncharacterized protein n=1 Tax=Halteria grandinella TaxID=5974 RepID=A0A8J8NUA7_HALGN|nr:hypothetical protein FGO68_gene11574 [Halteria grandinella]